MDSGLDNEIDLLLEEVDIEASSLEMQNIRERSFEKILSDLIEPQETPKSSPIKTKKPAFIKVIAFIFLALVLFCLGAIGGFYLGKKSQSALQSEFIWREQFAPQDEPHEIIEPLDLPTVNLL